MGVAAGEGVTCKNTANQMGLEYRYSFSTPCVVKVRDRWVPLDNVQDVMGQIETVEG
jgi:hypothetical protein